MLKTLLGLAFVAAVLAAWVAVFQDGDPGAWQFAAACFGGLVIGEIGFGLIRRWRRADRAPDA